MTFRVTPSAREDLIDIWFYTRETWGEAQADHYQDELFRCFEQIAAGQALSRPVPSITRIKSHRCRHHYVFFVEQEEIVVIIAVFHERMNVIERLKDRL